jgi:hypothetical protein
VVPPAGLEPAIVRLGGGSTSIVLQGRADGGDRTHMHLNLNQAALQMAYIGVMLCPQTGSNRRASA